MGFFDLSAQAITTGLLALKTMNPIGYGIAKAGIGTAGRTLLDLETILADDQVDAAEVQKVLDGITDKGVYRAVVGVISAILGHIKK
jgi:hypothetical protein